MSDIHRGNMAIHTMIILIMMFSSLKFSVCFMGTCNKDPSAAINAGYVYHYQY